MILCTHSNNLLFTNKYTPAQITLNTHIHTQTNLTTPPLITPNITRQSVSSTLPAFAKKGDLIIADEGVYEPLKTALDLSRSQVSVMGM